MLISPSKSSLRRISSSLCIASCLLIGVSGVTLAQTNPGYTFTFGESPALEQPLRYVLEDGTPGHPQDLYHLELGLQNTPIKSIWISYPNSYDGEFSEKSVTLQESSENRFIEFGKSKKISVTSIKVDKVTRLIKIVPKTPIVGKKSEIVLSNIQNPRSRRMYKFNCHIFVSGDVPLKQYLGTWHILLRSPKNHMISPSFAWSVLPICIIPLIMVWVSLRRNRLSRRKAP
jgi:hypothetical protein